MGSLARLVPRRERARVRARAAGLCPDPGSGGWPGPPSPQLRHRVCLTVTAIAPDLPDERLALLARYAGWSIRLDDQLDRADPDPAALAALERAVAGLTTASPTRPAGPVPDVPGPSRLLDPLPGLLDPLPGLLDQLPGLLDPLPGLLDQLAGCDRSGGQLVERFGAELRDAVTSGVQHALLGQAVAAGRQPPPTAEQYLEVAARTVNYRSFGYALLALAGGDQPGAGVDRALWHAAAAVRLANDLRSVERDRGEATLNVLRLRTAAGARVTGRWVRAGIARRRRAHDRALAGAPPPARMLTRCLRVSLGLYQLGDLR